MAVESVMAQDYPRVEHLIIDGGSTEGTLDVLARLAPGLAARGVTLVTVNVLVHP